MRYVDKLPSLNVDSYVALDVSLRWRPVENVETSLTGRNLTDKSHLEYGGSNMIERSIYGTVTWRY